MVEQVVEIMRLERVDQAPQQMVAMVVVLDRMVGPAVVEEAVVLLEYMIQKQILTLLSLVAVAVVAVVH
tara:strand:- start:290 stop:496 length:207 start_codon:yes stop_codon:yes gene_type:complete